MNMTLKSAKWLVKSTQHPCEPSQGVWGGNVYGDGVASAYPTHCPPWFVEGWIQKDANMNLADHEDGSVLGVPFSDPEVDHWIAAQYDMDILDLEPDIYDELQDVRG